MYVRGWVGDPIDGSPLSNVKVYVDGTLFGTPTLGIARPDVASYLNKPTYANSGFQLLASVASLSLGTHAVTVVAIDSGGRSTTLGPLTITVIGGPPVGQSGSRRGRHYRQFNGFTGTFTVMSKAGLAIPLTARR